MNREKLQQRIIVGLIILGIAALIIAGHYQ